MNRKRPRVLLIPDAMDWALGTIAKQIIQHIRSVDFYLLTEIQLLRNPQPLWDLLPAVDIIHWLNLDAFLSLAEHTRQRSVLNVNHIMDDVVLSQIDGADIFVVPAAEWREYLTDRLVPEQKIRTIRYGVDSAVFHPFEASVKLGVRRKLGIPADAFVVGLVGKASSDDRGRKGIDVFLEAVRQAARHVSRIFVLVSGPGWQSLAGTLRSEGIPSCVLSFVKHEAIVKAYNVMDAYVVTANIEGGPMTVLESMSCGVPTIATPVGLVTELLDDEVNGFIVPKKDVEAIVDRIVRLAASADLRQRIGTESRAAVVAHWQWSTTLQPLAELYDSLAASPSARAHTPFSKQSYPNPARQRRRAAWDDKLVWSEYLKTWNEGKLAQAVLAQAIIERPFRPDVWRLFMREYGPTWLKILWRRMKGTGSASEGRT